MRRPTTIAAVLLGLNLLACHDQASIAPTAVDGGAMLLQGQAGGLTLHPSGFGPNSLAAWKAQEGLEDQRGNADHALYFQKMTTTATNAAGVAEIRGFEGVSFSTITGLSWKHRVDGHCGAGAPRWTVAVREGDDRGFLHIGCAAAAHTPAGMDDQGRNWIMDTYTNASIAVAVLNGQASLTNPNVDLNVATIDALFIVFDEGNDVGPGFVYLDDITVVANGVTYLFTGPQDNGRS